jgi:hypothetical protein
LEQGLTKGFDQFADPKSNPLMLLSLPGEMDKIQSVLNTVGVKTNIPAITQKLTDAMRSSIVVSKPVFVNALHKMTLRDAVKILVTDNSHAATDYFKLTTTSELIAAITPIVDSTIKIQGADTEYKKIVEIYNGIPFVNKKLENSISGFVAGRAVDIMFMMVAKEEAEIRSKYNFNKSSLIKKVFGYAERELKKRTALK